LLIIANDVERREYIHGAQEDTVNLDYILTDLWPKLGFLPIDPENPGVALIAEFMLNELILKNSDSLEKLDLKHLKELFSGEGDDEENEEEMEEEMRQVMAEMEAEDESDKYSEPVAIAEDGPVKMNMNLQDDEDDIKEESAKKLNRSSN
jgi:hypothetical protein